MKITVILCTYNRCEVLTKALESVALQILPESVQWEVLVVDNNSSDQTRDVVVSFCKRLPERFRYLYESRPGKSHALNTGIHEARGDILAFMDDDVTVEPTWLQNLTKYLSNGEWAGVGGRTLLADGFSAPSWMLLDGLYSLGPALAALFDLGDEPCELRDPPYGTNMAFHKRMFDKYGGFRTNLGPRPGTTIRNEDTEFGRRVLANSERIRYEPTAVVYHPVPKGRIDKKYFLRWWFDYGRAEVLEIPRRPSIWGISRRYFTIPKMIVTVMPRKVFCWLFTFSPQYRFLNKCAVWKIAGQIREIHRQWGDAKSYDRSPDPKLSGSELRSRTQ